MSDKPRSPPPAAKAPARHAQASAGAGGKSKNGNDESLDFLGAPQGTDELGRLAHYRILKVLGRGGMGTVFLAEDTRLNRLLALKVMLPSLARKAIAHDRFKREALATAAIE